MPDYEELLSGVGVRFVPDLPTMHQMVNPLVKRMQRNLAKIERQCKRRNERVRRSHEESSSETSKVRQRRSSPESLTSEHNGSDRSSIECNRSGKSHSSKKRQ